MSVDPFLGLLIGLAATFPIALIGLWAAGFFRNADGADRPTAAE